LTVVTLRRWELADAERYVAAVNEDVVHETVVYLRDS